MDKQKADTIITEYLPKIYGFAIKKSFYYDEAEDLCSDIVAEVYPSLLAADDIYNLDGYIWRISEHVYAKFVASKKKHQGISLDEMIMTGEPEAPEEETAEEIDRLRREIAFLTKTRRRIVYSFYYEGKSIACISRETAIPEGTIKWHLNKARNELKKGFAMERKIGTLGLNPIKATVWGHDGTPGAKGGPEYYLRDTLNLNIVYSVYWKPRTKEEIAEELGTTLVFIEEKIDMLEANGFLVKQPHEKYTTYVCFRPRTYSIETADRKMEKQMQAAKILAEKYTPLVRQAIADVTDVYIPSKNQQLLEAAAIFYGISNKASLAMNQKYSRDKYFLKTTDGGSYIAYVTPESSPLDPDYKPVFDPSLYWACGNMTRWSEKYPVYSWSIDTRHSSRKGAWQNNLTEDYEYLYEFIKGDIDDTPANAEKFKRLRERQYITSDNKINIMVMKGKQEDFFKKIPAVSEDIKKLFAEYALEGAMAAAKEYPPQMQDMIIADITASFISRTVAIMVMDILYGDGTFRPLTEKEKVTSNLIMFCDILPE